MSSEQEQIAQQIFDQTQPQRDAAGKTISLPFERWRDDTRLHFMKLAANYIERKQT